MRHARPAWNTRDMEETRVRLVLAIDVALDEYGASKVWLERPLPRSLRRGERSMPPVRARDRYEDEVAVLERFALGAAPLARAIKRAAGSSPCRGSADAGLAPRRPGHAEATPVPAKVRAVAIARHRRRVWVESVIAVAPSAPGRGRMRLALRCCSSRHSRDSSPRGRTRRVCGDPREDVSVHHR